VSQRTSRAIVEVTLIIDTGDAWGDECTMGQIAKQAKDSALAKLRHAFERERKSPEEQSIAINRIGRVDIICKETT
jgi:hypothetical protein